jgi:homoserine kinase type II
MSVFTPVSKQQLDEHLQHYEIGELIAFQGISAGVENSNFFVTTSQGEYVLTLFESHGVEKISFYLGLMEHLADAGIPSIRPVYSKQGKLLLKLKRKPAVIVKRIKGTNPVKISAAHCQQIGKMLARFHRATQNYPQRMANEFDHHWQKACVQKLFTRLTTADKKLLQAELAFQDSCQAQLMALPTGIIHGDLFRDNSLFITTENKVELSAILDLYTACNDVLLIDLAIVLNDWCFQDNGEIDQLLALELINAYQRIRPFRKTEKALFNVALRASALRFWVLRLDLKYNPRASYNEVSDNNYDPDEYRNKLLTHIGQNYEIII